MKSLGIRDRVWLKKSEMKLFLEQVRGKISEKGN
jgi:hypothetical protein